MHAPVSVAPHQKTELRISNKLSIIQRLWPPAVLILALLMTLTWSCFLGYIVVRVVIAYF
jgi:hypothetical protein